MDINWIKDDAGIAVLAGAGIHVRDAVISIDSINRKASAENRARKIPLDESRLDGIKSAYQRGIPIPKIVVRKDQRQGNVIAGGNHRFNSLNGEKVIPVHIIECTDAEFEMACKLLNTVVGDGMSRQERISNAVNDHKRLGVDRKTVCRMYGIKEGTLADAIKHQELQLKLASFPASARDAVTQTHARILGDLNKNENVTRAAVSAIASTRMTAKDLSDLCKEAREAKTEAEQIVVFERFAKLHASDTAKVIPRTNKQSFLRACTQLRNMKDKKTWESLEFSKDEIVEAKAIASEIINILNCLCKANG